MPGRKLTVLIPVQEANTAYLNSCLKCLFESLPFFCEVYVVHAGICGQLSHQHGLNYLRYPEPVVVSTAELCRWAYESIAIEFSDILIVNPAVLIGPFVLEEMTAVLNLHERHAIVLPRSNSPGICAVPVTGPELAPGESYKVWRFLQTHLPRYQAVTYVDPSCMLIRRESLQHFGLFATDPTEQAYSERINRYGYSTLLANRAFVQVSPALPSSLQTESLVPYFAFDVDPGDYFAALAIPHRPRMLVDLYHLAPHYYGTSEFALNLLRELLQLAGEIELYIDIQPAAFEFFLPELQGYRLYRNASEPQLFDLVFKPTQINSWDELERMNRLAPRVAYTILDMIAVRCNYLSAPGRKALFLTAAKLCDRVFTLSHSAEADFAMLTGTDATLSVVHLGTNYGISNHEFMNGSYILLMGNAYAHKGIPEALAALEGASFPVVVLGGSPPATQPAANVQYLKSGNLSRAMMRATLANARVVVYPSHYEGFGLPVLDALALKKQVIVLDNDTNQEIEQLAGSECLQRISSVRELRKAVTDALNRKPECGKPPRRWDSAAREYLAAFKAMLDADIDYRRLRTRWNFLRARRA